jgi:tetratricopeptide (TPR) repeat protein
MAAGNYAAIRELHSAPLSHYAFGWRGCAYIRAGQRDKAEELLRQIEELRQRKYVSSIPAALIYAELGDLNLAFEHLEAAFQARDFQLYNLQSDPIFERLRSDVRYLDLCRRMKLV